MLQFCGHTSDYINLDVLDVYTNKMISDEQAIYQSLQSAFANSAIREYLKYPEYCTNLPAFTTISIILSHKLSYTTISIQ